MSFKDKLLARLTSDHLRLAELAQQEGRKAEACELFAKAGDYDRAVQMAMELRDLKRATEYSLRAVLGSVPPDFEGLDARQAGELLARSGKPKEALPIYELAGAWREAAEVALELQLFQRAARCYEKAKAYPEAAIYYERAGLLPEAARLLGLESKRLEQEAKRRHDPQLEQARRKVDADRGALFSRFGKTSETVAAVSANVATPKSPQMLEAAGRHREALEVYLAMGEPQQALRLLPKVPEIDRRLAAQIYLRCGRPGDAGNVYAALAMPREAADAYETAGEWEKAAPRWEAARDPLRAAQAYLRAKNIKEAGRAFLHAGQPLVAAEAFVQAAEHVQAAQAYAKAGKPLEAAAQFLAAKGRGDAIRALKQVPAGHADFERAILQLLPLLVEDGQMDEAWHRLRGLPADERLAPDLLAERAYWEGRVLEAQEKGLEAQARYEAAARARPGHRDLAERLRRLAARPPAV